jgi:hypothetical protein
MLTTDQARRFVLGSAALLAVVAVTCGGADTCSQATCTSGALLHIPLASSPASLTGTTVTVCRNAECYAATLPELPAADEASAGLAFAGASFVVGTLWQDADHTLGLDLEWHAESPDLVTDGDHYLVIFTDASGVPTTMLDRTATYSAVAPSPEECDGTASCRIAELFP